MTPLGRNQAVKLMLKKFAAEESVAEPANRLFDSYAWPNRFRRFRELKSPAARVKVAVARIDHFIKTNGAE